MSIDWLTVVAQIVNFLVLVWLLQHFLYHPVIDAMDKREQLIAERLTSAQQREETATETVKQFEDKQATLEQSRDEFLEKSKTMAQKEKLTLVEQARADVKKQRDSWLEQLKQEQQDYLAGIHKSSVDAIQQTGLKVLGELADSTLETQIIEVFLKRLQSLDDVKIKILKGSAESFLISSAFELDTATKTRITKVLHKQIDTSVKVEYALSKDLVCGINLETAGYQIGWNIKENLQHLDDELQQILKREFIADV